MQSNDLYITRKTAGSVCYLAALSLFLIGDSIQQTYIFDFLNSVGSSYSLIYYMKAFSYTLLIIKIIFLSNYSPKELIAACLMFLISLLSYISTLDITFAVLLLFILGAIGVNFRSVCKYYAISTIIVITVTVALALSGVIANRVVTGQRLSSLFNGMLFTRNSMGFHNGNQLALQLDMAVFAIYYLRYDRLRLFDYCGLLALAAFEYSLVNSLSGTLALILIALFTLSSKRLSSDWLFGVGVFVAFASLVISISSGFNYSPFDSMWVQIDNLLSQRPEQIQSIISRYSLISAFGNAEINIDQLPLDNGYVYLILHNGIIGAIFLAIVYGRIMSKARAANNKAMLIILLILFIYSVTESCLSLPRYSLILLATFSLWEKKDTRSKSSGEALRCQVFQYDWTQYYVKDIF